MSNADTNFYRILSARSLTSSQRDFSSYYLGMAENYTCLRGERVPSKKALAHLFRRLWEEHRYLLALKVAVVILWEVERDV